MTVGHEPDLKVIGFLSAPAAAATDQFDYDQQHHRAYDGADKSANDSNSKDAKIRQQPTANEGADDSNHQVAHKPEAGALNNLAGQPSSDETDHQEDNNAFDCHVRDRSLGLVLFVPLRIRAIRSIEH
jgi:hypothetical protein